MRYIKMIKYSLINLWVPSEELIQKKDYILKSV